MRFAVVNNILVEQPTLLGVEQAVEHINNLRGNFKGIKVINPNPSEVSKKAEKADNRHFVKYGIHYVVLGKKHYTQEEIAEFEAKGEREDLEIISKNLRVKKGVMYFFARYNANKNLKSKVIFVDTNTNEVFTRQQMIDNGYFIPSKINQAPRDYEYAEFRLDRICEI